MIRHALLLTAVCGAVCAEPFIAYRGVVNAASSMSAGLPSGGVARGSTFSIYGRRIGPASSPALAFPLSTTLGGVSITVSQGSATVNAIPVFVSPGQINAIMPSNAPLGTVSVRVLVDNVRSNPVPVRVLNSSFGIFSANSAGTGPGILQNYLAPDRQPLNALNATASRGQVLTLWGTGLGPVSADNLAPTPGNLPTPTEVYVGGIAAPIQYNGRSPCCAGIDQIVFTIPSNAPLGCWVPVYVKTDRSVVSNFVTIAITNGGDACDEPGNTIARTLIRGGRGASFLAARFAIHADVGVPQTIDMTTDFIGGYLAGQNAGPFNFNPLLSLPPEGSCTAYGIAGNLSRSVPPLPGMLPTGGGLNAGPLSVTGSRGTAQTVTAMPQFGIAKTHLGSSISLFPQLASLFFDANANTVAGAGGPDVGAFSAQVAIPQGLTWTNRDEVRTITRGEGFTVNWSGAAAGHSVFITGGSVDVPTNSSTVFVCQVSPGAASFRVPADVLANIAPARRKATQSIGAVYVGQWPLASPAGFTATGLDSAALLGAQVIARTVVFK